MAISRQWESPIFVYLKKHNCPKCSTILEVKKEIVVVNSKSPEAKNYDFSHGTDTFLIGDVKFIYDVFRCPNCGNKITVKDMKRIEKNSRKK